FAGRGCAKRNARSNEAERRLPRYVASGFSRRYVASGFSRRYVASGFSRRYVASGFSRTSLTKLLQTPLRRSVRRIGLRHALEQVARIAGPPLPEPRQRQQECRGWPTRIEQETRLERLRGVVEVAGEQLDRPEVAIEAGIVFVENRQRRELAAHVAQPVEAGLLQRRTARVDQRHERCDAHVAALIRQRIDQRGADGAVVAAFDVAQARNGGRADGRMVGLHRGEQRVAGAFAWITPQVADSSRSNQRACARVVRNGQQSIERRGIVAPRTGESSCALDELHPPAVRPPCVE